MDSVWTVLIQTVKRAPACFDMHQVFTARGSLSTLSALRYLLIPAFTHKNAATEQLKKKPTASLNKMLTLNQQKFGFEDSYL